MLQIVELQGYAKIAWAKGCAYGTGTDKQKGGYQINTFANDEKLQEG